jgi:hypothetical protein
MKKFKKFSEFVNESEQKNYDFYADTSEPSNIPEIDADKSEIHSAFVNIENKEKNGLKFKNKILNDIISTAKETSDKKTNVKFSEVMTDNSEKMVKQMIKSITIGEAEKLFQKVVSRNCINLFENLYTYCQEFDTIEIPFDYFTMKVSEYFDDLSFL